VAERLKTHAGKLFAGLILLGIAATLLNSCAESARPAAPIQSGFAETQSVTHRVLPGETIYHIANAYMISPARLMAVNGLSDPRQLQAGQILIIPGQGGAIATAGPASTTWPLVRADRQFGWPVTGGLITSGFGIRNGVMHHGVDIVAAAGTPVHAADDGVVMFAGRLRGYGNVVILQHSDGYITVYGHNQRNLVSAGERVVRGQAIGELGATGRATAPNLHFEVRVHGQAENPLAYLPPPMPSGISFARNNGS
jgi:lipoprotein NlpD